MTLQVTGPAGSGLAPVGSSAVALNVTATGATAQGYLSVSPAGSATSGSTSNLNLAPGAATANLVVSKVSTGGSVTIYNSTGSVDVVADLQGSYGSEAGGAGYRPLEPRRLLDTRTGVGAPTAKVGPAGSLRLQVTGAPGSGLAPLGTTAVALNVTATNPTATSYVSVYPSGFVNGPTVSHLNVTPGQTAPNLVLSKVAEDGSVTLYNNAGTVDLVADLQGSYGPWPDASRYRPLDPQRLLDTRSGQGAPTAKVPAGGTIRLKVTGPEGSGLAPVGTTAVSMNVTATNPTTVTYVAAFPSDYPDGRLTSNLNVAAGMTRPNSVVSKVAPDGTVTLYNHAGTVDLIADLGGAFVGSSP